VRFRLSLLAATVVSILAAAPMAAQQATAPARSGNVQEITREQIEQSNATNAEEVIRRYQPAWLRHRGVQSLREGARVRGGQTPGSTEVDRNSIPLRRVYINNASMGGVETLMDIAAATVHSIQYYPPAEATRRWGPGHNHGVILIITH
jgi:hypothetical protein